MEKIRLSRLMALRGICSRREADRLIEQGLVRVDGKLVTELGTRVEPASQIELAPAARNRQKQLVTVVLNKPVGYVSGQPEKGYRAASELIAASNRYPGDRSSIRFRPAHRVGLAPAGRLDIDSRGLLILTQDGRVARRLIGPASNVEKEYLVRVEGTITAAILNRLRSGLALDGRPLRRARVECVQPNLLRMVLTEGRKRQIRRMCEQVGLRVTGLKRVRIGGVKLGALPEGRWRYLAPWESF